MDRNRETYILLILTAAFLFLGSTLPAQPAAPDLSEIRLAIKDPASPCHWPTLIKKYEDGDSTLSMEQKRCLYYGRSLQPDYNGYARSNYEDSVRAVLKNQELMAGDHARILMFTDSVLRESPFNIRYLNYRIHAARRLGNVAAVAKARAQLHSVAEAIESTGDGKSAQTAYWVTNVPDEYSMLSWLGHKFGGSQSLVDGPCDKLAIEHEAGGQEAVYFNVSISMGSLEKMFGGGKNERKKRK